MKKSVAAVLWVLALTVACAAGASTLQGRVVAVADGDTVTVLDAEGGFKTPHEVFHASLNRVALRA